MHTQKTNRIKKVCSLVALLLLAAGCSPLGGSAPGAGVAKTTNGSTDWVFANKAEVPQTNKKKKPKPEDSPLANASVLNLAFSPDSPQKVYATTQALGVFYSENSTDNWKQILTQFNAYDMAIDPSNPDLLYVSGQAEGQARVLASNNRGQSWDQIYNDAATQNIARTIALDPNNSKTIVVGLASGNLISSTDSGSTWSLIQNFQDPVAELVWHKSRKLFILTRGKGLYVSFDGGRTVQNVSAPLLSVDQWQQQAVQNRGNDKTAVAPIDIPAQQTSTFYRLSVGVNNAQLLYIAANNGLFSSADGGITWRYLKLPLRTAQATDVRAVALADNDSLIYASVGNTIFKSVNAGASWQVTAIATPAAINYILVDPTAPQIAYTGFIGVTQ